MNDDYIIEQTKSILIDSLNKSRLPSGVLIYILRDILKQLEEFLILKRNYVERWH